MPAYQVTNVYIRNVNVHAQRWHGPQPQYERPVRTGPIMYTNQGVAGGVTVVPQNVMQGRQPISSKVAMAVDARTVSSWQSSGARIVQASPGGAVRDAQRPLNAAPPAPPAARVVAAPGAAVPAPPNAARNSTWGRIGARAVAGQADGAQQPLPTARGAVVPAVPPTAAAQPQTVAPAANRVAPPQVQSAAPQVQTSPPQREGRPQVRNPRDESRDERGERRVRAPVTANPQAMPQQPTPPQAQRTPPQAQRQHPQQQMPAQVQQPPQPRNRRCSSQCSRRCRSNRGRASRRRRCGRCSRRW